MLAASGLATGMSLPALAANDRPKQATDLREDIFVKVWNTQLMDTHEHLFDERDSLSVKDDWTVVLSGYLGADLLSAGMPPALHKRFYSQGPSPREKWKILAPYWPAVKNSG